MATKSAIERYEAKQAELDQLAADAKGEMREQAKAIIAELKDLNDKYYYLTGEDLPEYGKVSGGGGKKGGGKSSGGGKRTRTKLSGKYEGMTIPDAIEAAIGNTKSGMGPQEIADKIGGNKQSVAVAVAKMVKESRLKRVSRGKYTKG